MSPVRLTVVSDSHLSPRTPEAEANWTAVVDYVAQAVPDLVIHLGDLSLNGLADPDDLRFGRAQLDRLPVPWLAVPGNHDIGDNPSPATPPEVEVTAEKCERWVELVGADRWSVELRDWSLVAINAQLIGSGLEAEEEQRAWLEGELATRAGRQPVALVTHKPIDAAEAELSVAPPYRFLPRPDGRPLIDAAGAAGIELVLSGHVHQYRRLDIGATAHVWAPTTWAVLPDDSQPVVGVKRCGVLSLTLDNGGFEEVLVEPEGIRQQTLGQDLPDPYLV
ncbi:MAG TPA: metallophosphoesterase [Acidimicrobiales bacterium]|nr:metallophosphoesterase [Acidimicrobiales bacterium]